MFASDLIRTKVELQCLGVRLDDSPGRARPRTGGAGPAEGITITIGGLVATLPTGAAFVERSPFALRAEADGSLVLTRDGVDLMGVEIVAAPAFYSNSTADGTPMNMVALRHGIDAIGTTVVQSCARGEACLFCGIALSGSQGRTVARKSPGQLAEVAARAAAEGFTHTVLTTGTTNFEDCGIADLEPCAAAVSLATDSAMKVHVQFEPPSSEEWIERAAAVADTAAINIECFDEATLRRVAPGKAAVGIERYKRTWSKAVEKFGAGMVTSFIIVGIGEPRETVLEGCRLLTSLGIYPYVLPLRPIPGTALGESSPPATEYMLSLLEDAASIIGASGMRAAECPAGCVRCGACSAITDLA